MDLTFDVQVARFLAGGDVPGDVLESNRAYYKRVTVDSFPMGGLVGVVMCVGLICNAIRLRRSDEALWRRLGSLVLLAVPSVWAVFFIFPDARRLAGGADDVDGQSLLAIRILIGHVSCLALVIALAVIQFWPRRGRMDH